MSPSLITRLSTPDLAIVALYLVGITIFGLRFARRGKQSNSLKGYFLADNTIPWWAIALSIVSAETSTLTIISIPGVAFAGDLGFLQVVFGYMIGRIVVAALFLPKYFRGEMLTAYQLIDRRFGPVLHKVTAGLFLLTRAAAEGVRVFAISIVVSIAIGTGDILSIAIISALTLLYTFEGGMAAVIWTDVVQMGLYILGTLAALWAIGDGTPGGWSHIHAVAAPLGKFQLFHFAFNLTQSYTFWAGVLGGTFLTMASHGTDQLMVQRMLAARNLRESRLALLSSGVVIFFQFTLFLLIGVGLFVFYGGGAAAGAPHIASEMWVRSISTDRIFPSFIVEHMPHGVAGLLVAAILAAAMSNLSAALNSLASTTVIDFYVPIRAHLSGRRKGRHSERSEEPPYLPSSPPHQLPGVPFRSQSHRERGGVDNPSPSEARTRTLVSRSATVFWALILFAIAVYAIQHGGKGHVVETGLSIASVAYGSLLGVFLLGTLTRYATQTGATVGMLCGFALNLYLWRATHIAFTWYVLIGSLATFALGSLFSLLLPKPRRALTASVLTLGLFGLSFRSEAQESAVVPSASSAQPLRPLRSSFPQPATNAPDFSEVSTLIDAAIAAHKLPGAVVLIGHNGQVVFHHAYGNRAIEPTVEPMTEDTVFDMASLTKVLVTTTAILQLYEQGKLDPVLGLDTPVAHYLPAFAATTNLSVIPSEAQSAQSRNPRISPSSTPSQLASKSQITIRQLLTHYSSLPEDVDLKDDWGLRAPSKAEGIRRAMQAIPYGPPGVTFKYSDINFILLGALVEKLSGQRLDDFAQREIFQPILRSGMLATSSYHSFDRACRATSKPVGSAVEPGRTPRSSNRDECFLPAWSPTRDDPHTAPTAHDDQGTALTNPDFDHLLRGTVHDPTTRRMGGVAGHAGVFSTAEDMSRFCDALLAKLLHNTGPFPLKQSTLQLATSPNEPATAARTATIFTPDGHTSTGVASRGLGWDFNSPFSRPRGEIFPITTHDHPGSFGHTGFTGTSLWLDPVSDTYVILLSNAIHPHVGPNISPVRGAVATAAALALAGSPEKHVILSEAKDPRISSASKWPEQTRASPTLTGIDVLELTHFAAFALPLEHHFGHLRLGLLANAASLDSHGRRTADILLHTLPNVTLTTLYTPEHGLRAAQDTEHLTTETDPATHLPVIDLYGTSAATRHPTPDQFKDIDALIIDLQDAGVRFWTYETLLGYLRETLAFSPVEIIILDRPNPLGGLAVQGQTSDYPHGQDYTNYLPIPLRHGLTFGELAGYFNAQFHACDDGTCAPLTVVPMQHWTRAEFFSDTSLPWTPPSPNLKSARAAVLYPALGLVEQTNISVGRGTPTPFENLGAPYIDADALAKFLTGRSIPGVTITPTTLTVAETPERYPSHGQTVPGVHFEVTDPATLDSPELGLEILSALHTLYPAQFKLAFAGHLLANAATLAALERGDDPRAIASSWSASLDTFKAARQHYLLYP